MVSSCLPLRDRVYKETTKNLKADSTPKLLISLVQNISVCLN